ncbi:MAG TPA: hypothetical protein VGG28_07605 [Kofleriaceae bacterium]
MKRLYVVAAFALAPLAACPPQQAPQPPQPQIQGAGCPAASGVYLASYASQDAGKGRTGWVMPLHAKADAGSDAPDYQAIDDATATAAGVPASPTGNLWLVTGNAPPCMLKVGGHYQARIETSLTYGVEIDGCPAPTDPQDGTGIVLLSQDTPSSCTFQAPQPVAGRLGQMTGPKAWQKPEAGKDTPIPPELAPLVPQHECAAPGCEQLWAVGEVRVDSKPVVWAAAVNWLTVGDPANVCDWKAERWSGFFVPGADGAPQKVTEGLTHPLALSAVLVDHSGARVILAEGPGEYATYDITPPGGAKLGQLVTWMAAPDDEWAAIDHLGPTCEPDAKPQSPYP